MPTYLRHTLTAISTAALVTFAGQAESIMLTFDLNNGTIDNMVKYDSGPIMIALPQVPMVVVPQAPSLQTSIVFKDHQLLKLTDGGSDIIPNQEEQIFTVKFVGPGDPALQPTQIVELDATITLELTGLSAMPKEPNPDEDDFICTVSQASTECSNISLGFGDLTDGMISFKDIHFKLMMDPAQIMFGMFNGMGGSVASLRFNAVQFIAFGDKVEISVPEPSSLVLLCIGILGTAGYGCWRLRRQGEKFRYFLATLAIRS